MLNEPEPTLGTLEEYFNDSLEGLKVKQRQMHDQFTSFIQAEH